MSKIITVTAHTAVDLLIEADGLYQRDNLVAKNSREFACGKGINVGKAVESLGHPAVCLGFAGRQSIGLFDTLNSALLHVDLIAVEGKTRTNITLSDRTAGRETHIRTSGYRVTPEDCLRLAEKIEEVVQAGDIVIFAGSLPPGAPGDFYRTLIGVCRGRSAFSILDSSGVSLAEGIKASPNLIKPNLQELEELAGRPLNNAREALNAAFPLLARGIARVCVSLGAQGAIAAEGTQAFAACVPLCPSEKTTQIGCGDALVAGLAAGMLRRLPWEDCVGLGIACGTANLYSAEPGRFVDSQAGEILRQVRITPMPYGSG
jgi:1-phosphofructokinase